MTGPNPILEDLGPVEGFARRAEHAVGHLFHHHDARSWHGTCGDCADGLVPTVHGACNCGSPADESTGFRHEPLCGYEPCPNGCWDLLHPRTQAPADRPVNLAAATAAVPREETPMSLTSDVEQGYAAVKAELGKFDTALPGLLARARAFEASPFAAVAEKAASAVLPPEAVAIAVKAAESVLDDMNALYNPPQPVADPAAPVAPAPVQ